MEKYHSIYKHYEACFDKYGASHQGVDWPNMEDLYRRFQVMLNVHTDNSPVKLLDFGCGNGLLYAYLEQKGVDNITYTGLDISQKFIDFCQETYSGIPFICSDITKDGLEGEFDYIICNGTFTEKMDLTFDEMFSFMSQIIYILFQKCSKGIAFNVMSPYVDNEREDLFHVPTDHLLKYVVKNLSRNFIIRNDYGLYEYTVYVYK